MNKNIDKTIDKLYNLLSDELEYIVKRIKQRPATTKNNYGDYMRQITELKQITNLRYDIICKLLERAGGSKIGINDAMRIINI